MAPEEAALLRLVAEGGGLAGVMATVAGVAAVGMGMAARRLGVGPEGLGTIDELINVGGLSSDGLAMVLDGGGFAAVLEVEGVGHDQAPADRLAQWQRLRSAALARLHERGCVVRLVGRRVPGRLDVQAEHRHEVLRELHERSLAPFRRAFRTRRYLVISGPVSLDVLDECLSEAVDLLKPFRPVRLGGGELVRWWGEPFDADGALSGPAAGTVQGMKAALGGVEPIIDLGLGLVSIPQGMGYLHYAVAAVREWSDDDGHRLVDGVLALPHALSVVATTKRIRGAAGASELLDRRRKMVLTRRPNSIVEEEFRDTMALVDAGRVAMMETGLVVIVRGPTREEVGAAIGAVRQVFAERDHKLIIERRGAGHQWLSALPGYDRIVRPRQLTSVNVGRLWRWPAEPVGLDRSGWGPGAIRVFPAWGGAPYSFQFHRDAKRDALGHLLVIGGTDAGKTTAIMHLVGGALRHPDVFALLIDRHFGMRVWGEAVGADYLNPADPTTMMLNPLQVADTRSERMFMHLFLRQLAGVDKDDTVGHDEITRALDKIFEVPAAKRSLEGVWSSAFSDGRVKHALKRWANKEDLGGLINGERDTLTFRRGKPVVLDFTQLVSDESAMAAVTSVVMHRVREACRGGRPHVIAIDETAPILADPVFRKATQEILREHRKLLGVVILAFQEIAGLVASGLSEIILRNVAQTLIFPQESYEPAEWSAFKFTPEQESFVSGDHPAIGRMKRPAMLKGRNGSVIIDLSLSHLGGWLNVYKGGAESAANMAKLKREHGERWLDVLVS